MWWRAMSSRSSKKVKVSKSRMKRSEDEQEVIEEAAEHVEIDDGWEIGSGAREDFCGGFAIFSGRLQARFAELTAAAHQAAPGDESREKGKRRRLAPIAFHARQEGEADQDEDEIGRPHAEEGREHSLASHAGADDEEQIVAGDNQDGEQRAGSAATAARLRAKGNGDQRE